MSRITVCNSLPFNIIKYKIDMSLLRMTWSYLTNANPKVYDQPPQYYFLTRFCLKF